MARAKQTREEREQQKTDADKESFVFWLVQDEHVTDVTVSWSRDGGQTWLKNVLKGQRGSTE